MTRDMDPRDPGQGALSMARVAARRLLPLALRVEARRLAHLPRFLLESASFPRRRLAEPDTAPYRHVLAARSSPLRRPSASGFSPRLQRGKERNVALAARRLDRLLVGSYEVFSYHFAVGRPSRWRGFRAGCELREGRLAAGVGGGCCQVSNLLYVLALEGGMRIVERHRHGLDLFADHERRVPFGCGATVFYSYVDLRFENPLPFPVLLRLDVTGGELRGRLLAAQDPGFRIEIYEADHRVTRERDGWVRENRIRRRFLRPDGAVLLDQEVAHNRARLRYDPEGGSRCGAPR